MRISDWSSDVCSSDLAEALRLDAESLKAEYEAKLADAAKEADEMRARADSEAEALVAKAKADATALITRRKKMAEDRIAAAEAGALAEVRTAAAKAATEQGARLIADTQDAAGHEAPGEHDRWGSERGGE